MILDSPEESMCDDDVAGTSEKKQPVDDSYSCIAEYKADIYKYMREKEVTCDLLLTFLTKTR